MSKRFTVGGVPEHFNLPWYRAKERGLFDGSGLDYDWRVFPGGTGAMLQALDSGEIDLAVLLTEGVVAHIAAGGDARVLGTYVDSPLVWGIHVHSESPFERVEDLKGARFGISRRFSGSHLMAFVLAEQMGWSPTEDVALELVKNLDGAREALGQNKADVFLWEKYTTKPVVDSGEWRRLGTCTAPWPPFVLAATTSFARERRDDLQTVVRAMVPLTEEMHAEKEATIADVARRFGQKEEDARQWLSETNWALKLNVEDEAIDEVVDTLVGLGVLEEPLGVDDIVG